VKNRDHTAVFTGIEGRPSRHKTASDRFGYAAPMPVSHPTIAEVPLTGLSFGTLAESGMRVLLTGGTGVIGTGVIPELLAAGYQVRLLSRAAKG
jgi:hypothetical protein